MARACRALPATLLIAAAMLAAVVLLMHAGHVWLPPAATLAGLKDDAIDQAMVRAFNWIGHIREV